MNTALPRIAASLLVLGLSACAGQSPRQTAPAMPVEPAASSAPADTAAPAPAAVSGDAPQAAPTATPATDTPATQAAGDAAAASEGADDFSALYGNAPAAPHQRHAAPHALLPVAGWVS